MNETKPDHICRTATTPCFPASPTMDMQGRRQDQEVTIVPRGNRSIFEVYASLYHNGCVKPL